MAISFSKDHWALVLGGSSGIGLATAERLARHGMSVCVVHRDRKGAMGPIERSFEWIRATGVGFRAFNVDALSEEGRAQVLDGLAEALGEAGKVRLLLHSIAFGNLKLLAPPPRDLGAAAARARARLAEALSVPAEKLDEAVAAVAAGDETGALAGEAPPPADAAEALLAAEDFARTVDAMGTSLATWARAVFERKLFAADARVIGLTSEGNQVAWRGYAAVAAAKVALESVSRALAVELGPHGVRANIVQAGVTDTPALRRIPGADRMKSAARRRNPLGRLTTPEDVAAAICLLCTDEAAWVNGAHLHVDGGEHVSG